MSNRVLVCLAPGFEEIEAVCVVDILRRAGVEVVVGGLDGTGPTLGSRGMRVVPDVSLDTALGSGPFDAVVLPGGRGGTDRLASDARVRELAAAQLAAGRWLGAICAAPEVLHAAGVLAGRTVTSHPSSRTKLAGARYSDERVVRDGPLITSRGPGTAIEFAYALVERLCGAAKVAELNAGVLAKL